MFKSLPIHHFSSLSCSSGSTGILTSPAYPPRRVATPPLPVAAASVSRAGNFQDYDRQAFVEYLQRSKDEGGKEQELETATDVACFVGTWHKSGKGMEDFIKSYAKPNSYNNALNSLKHYCDFLGVPRPALRQKPRVINSLIISPKTVEVFDILAKVKSDDVRCYLGLCATVGLRPQRLMKAKWSEIDFENAWVMIDERHGKKRYVPNPLHRDVAAMLQALKRRSTNERVFGFAYKKVANELKATGSKWRPNNLRDHFYNEGRRHADHDIIEWLMGHKLPGVRGHYLADNIKEEYAKFESNVRIPVC